MRKKQYEAGPDCVYLTIDEASAFFNMSRQQIEKLAAGCDAKIKFGRTARYRRDKMQQFLNSFEA